MMLPISIDDQIRCVERELSMRKRVYSRRVSAGQMDPDEADLEIARMEAILVTVKAAAPEQQVNLFN